ncbi:MAG TPA: AbrB family transcriptional regulator, partial [Xanthobacteraceae bacterium]|nr:AbrB family transcriptional regulator [Xanthobacteraceae bacterium]
MTVSESKGRLMLRLSETLLIGAIGGALLGLSGFPAGWLSGAIIAVTAAALIGRPVVIPPVMGQGVLVVVGISLGAAVTPATLARVSSWPGSLFILAVAMTCATAAMMFYLHRFQKWDLLSALFATSPGAMAQLLAMAAEVGADFRAIAMVQSVRVLALTVALPLVLAAFGATGTPVPRAAVSLLDGSAGELIVLVLVSGAGAVLAHRLRVPGGLTSGAMTISGVLHVTGLIKVTFPPSVAIASFV